jgi:hypothetical protein
MLARRLGALLLTFERNEPMELILTTSSDLSKTASTFTIQECISDGTAKRVTIRPQTPLSAVTAPFVTFFEQRNTEEWERGEVAIHRGTIECMNMFPTDAIINPFLTAWHYQLKPGAILTFSTSEDTLMD